MQVLYKFSIMLYAVLYVNKNIYVFTTLETGYFDKDKLINNGSAFRAGDEIISPREIPASELEGRKTSEEVNNEYARLLHKSRPSYVGFRPQYEVRR